MAQALESSFRPQISLTNRQTMIMGMRVDLMDERALVERIFDDLDSGRGGWIVTPNVDILRQCTRSPSLHTLVEGATLRLVDGAPLEWTSRLVGEWRGDRIPGAAMPWVLGRPAAERGRRFLLVGGRPQAAVLAAENLARTFPNLSVHHHFPPMGFETNEVEQAALRRAIRDSQADIVFVGLGFPKQERLIDELRQEFPSVWFIGCGAAIDFVAGVVPRAPEWAQKAGVEWGYRLLTEPRRLGKRYLVHDLPFAARMLGWAAAQPRRSAA